MYSATNEFIADSPDLIAPPTGVLPNRDVNDLEIRLQEMLFISRFMGATSATLVPHDICSIAARILYDFICYERILFTIAPDFGVEPMSFSPGRGSATKEGHDGACSMAGKSVESRVDAQCQGIIFRFQADTCVGIDILLPEKMGDIAISMNNTGSSVPSASLFAELAAHFSKILKNALAHEKVKELATKDSLTSLFNRRVFDELLAVELKRTELMPVSLLLIDLDDFKQVNDSYGHQAGDQVLATIGKILREGCRGSDMVARYGGEEFAVMLPSTPAAAAEEIARRLRKRIAATVCVFDGQPVKLTASIGIAQTSGGRSDAMTQLISRADQALYQAKKSGKNAECVYRCRTAEMSKRQPGKIADVAWLKTA